MDIEEFIKTTIKQIKANLVLSPDNPKSGDTYMNEPVDFDLAVVVSTEDSNENKTEGGGSIKIASLDKEASSRTGIRNEMVSRVRFSIHIVN